MPLASHVRGPGAGLSGRERRRGADPARARGAERRASLLTCIGFAALFIRMHAFGACLAYRISAAVGQGKGLNPDLSNAYLAAVFQPAAKFRETDHDG